MLLSTSGIENRRAELQTTRNLHRKFDLLIELAWHVAHPDPDEAERLFRQARALFGASNSQWPRYRFDALHGILQHRQEAAAEARPLLERSLKIAAQNDDFACQAYILRELGYIAISRSDFTSALRHCEMLAALFRNDDRFPLPALLLEATIYSLQCNYAAALRCNHRIIEWATAQGKEQMCSAAWLNCSNIYRKLFDYDYCRRCINKALPLFRRGGNMMGQVAALENLADIEYQEENYQASLALLEEALDIALRHRLVSRCAGLYIQMGATLCRMERYEDAWSALEKAESYRDNGLRAQFVILIENKADILIQRGAYADAAELLERGMVQAVASGISKVVGQIHAALAQVYTYLGNTKAELHHLKCSIELFDKEIGPEVQQEIGRISTAFEQRQRDAERRLLQMKNVRLQDKLQRKNEELTNLALDLARKRQGFLRLREDLQRQYGQQHARDSDLYDSLLQRINGQISNDDEWSRFEKQFSAVNSDFIVQLSSRCPLLSPTEIKVCTLLHIQLRSKEIADALYMSVATVNTHRQRIRKKLGLRSGENLNLYMGRL